VSVQVIFLGTAASIPTDARALPSVVVRRKNEVFMFDCGEGVQRQMIRARVGFHRKMRVFVSHMHGDHVLGLPGLLQSMSLLDRREKLWIYGPVGIRAFIEAIKKTVQFVLTFPVTICEIECDGVVCDEREYYVEAVRTAHVIPSFAYSLVEKPRAGRFSPDNAKALGVPEGPLWSKLQHGKSVKNSAGKIVKPAQVVGPTRPGLKIAYSGDTRSTRSLVKLAKGADLLIHEATLMDELADRAKRDGHSTPSQAARIAKQAGAKRLILTHVSARYRDVAPMLKEARKIFKATDVAEDFMTFELEASETVQ
jgi:ribonuclease Z